jgi:hypothetical protein
MHPKGEKELAATVFFAGPSETATLSNLFTVTSGGVTTPTDPTTVTLTVNDPSGASTTYTYAAAQINRSGAGLYFKDIPSPTAGEWSFTWAGTGTVPDVVHGSYTVLETNLGHLYATPQMIKSRVGLSPTDTSNDYELQGSCYAASRAIETMCSRVFWRGTDTRAFDNEGDLFRVDLGPYNDLVSVTTIKTDNDGDGVFETTMASSDYQLWPTNTSGPEQRPYTAVHRLGGFWPVTYWPTTRPERIQITGMFGWPSVPWPITEAAKMLAAEFYKMKDAPFGVANVGEFGQVQLRSNPRIADLIAPYRYGNSFLVG